MDISQLRSDARFALDAAVEAVRPETVLPRLVERRHGELSLAGMDLPPVCGRRLVAAIGKAAPGLASAWIGIQPDGEEELFVLTPHGVSVPPDVEAVATVRRGAHPYPDAAGEAAARELLERVAGLGADDLLLVLLSGGGSALMAAPEPGLELADILGTTELLLRAGAPIGAVNTVRRELLAAGGGGLARAAQPAPVRTAVLSDVIGDPLPDIASGPTVPSPTGPGDALEVLHRFGVENSAPRAVLGFLGKRPERPLEGWWERCKTVILANNRTAVAAAARALQERGWRGMVPASPLLGEASARGRQLGALGRAADPARPTALVLGGETTVTVHGRGRGGRNQELALAAALVLEGRRGRVLLAAGTDGIDGPTENAGGLVDGGTVERIRQGGVDPRVSLSHNDAATALEAAGDALRTGPTGTNVCDLTLVLMAAR